MCGRFTLTAPEGLASRFGVTGESGIEAQYNIAPSQLVTAILERRGRRTVQAVRWGFRPTWAREESSHPAPINARAETLQERALFRSAFAGRRCLIPADGFYEWQVTPNGARQPVYFRRRDGGLFAFAGLCTTSGEGEHTGGSCAIVTCMPNALVAPVHGRMPAILTAEAETLWLDGGITAPEALLPLLCPYPAEALEAYPVRPLVNDARREGADLIRPLAAA